MFIQVSAGAVWKTSSRSLPFKSLVMDRVRSRRAMVLYNSDLKNWTRSLTPSDLPERLQITQNWLSFVKLTWVGGETKPLEYHIGICDLYISIAVRVEKQQKRTPRAPKTFQEYTVLQDSCSEKLGTGDRGRRSPPGTQRGLGASPPMVSKREEFWKIL